MRFTQSCLAVGAIVLSMTLPNVCWAKSSVDTRIERLENILDNQVNADLLNQLDAMQQEVQELRGKVEEQQHEIQLLTQKQEKLFLNLDSRIGSLSTNAGSTAQSILPPEPAPLNVPVIDPKIQDATGPIAIADSIWRVTEHKEKESYDSAYKLITTKQYPAAVEALNVYLEQYPAGTYAPNAYYWLGEVYISQWQSNKTDQDLIRQAITAFNTVVNEFPQHHKAVDALLKLGIVEAEQNHFAEAKGLFAKVMQRYPDTTGARIAESKLKSLQ